MSQNYVTITPPLIFEDILNEMLENNQQEVLIVDEREKLQGIITFSDLNEDKIECAETSYDVISVSPDASLSRARRIMREHSIGRLPVTEDGKVVGILRKEDLFLGLYENKQILTQNFFKLLDNVQEAVCVINCQGEVVVWNERAAEITGVEKKEIVEENIYAFFPDSLLPSVLKKERAVENIKHSPRPGLHIIISARPVYFFGELLGVIATAREVEEVADVSWQVEKKSREEKGEKAKVKTEVLPAEKVRAAGDDDAFQLIKGSSEGLEKMKKKARQAATTDFNVLLLGESGTGKELFARAIHRASERSGSFVPVNCSAIPADLFESEMFGYVEGAFTGASSGGKKGYFEMADGGTLFLDEIESMPLSMQAKLLRVLQERRIKRVGSEEFIDVDVRIISAASTDLKKKLNNEEFRQDLYYRIDVIDLELPPLRERKEDIPELLEVFLRELSWKSDLSQVELCPGVMGALISYGWPGNIRELKNTAKHLLAFASSGRITVECLPDRILNEISPAAEEVEEIGGESISKIELEEIQSDIAIIKQMENLNLEENLEEMEKRIIAMALKKTSGNKSRAADLLKIPRSTLHYKIDKYDIKMDDQQSG